MGGGGGGGERERKERRERKEGRERERKEERVGIKEWVSGNGLLGLAPYASPFSSPSVCTCDQNSVIPYFLLYVNLTQSYISPSPYPPSAS